MNNQVIKCWKWSIVLMMKSLFTFFSVKDVWFEPSLCSNAAEGGHLHVLKWLRAKPQNCAWDVATCYYAAIAGTTMHTCRHIVQSLAEILIICKIEGHVNMLGPGSQLADP